MQDSSQDAKWIKSEWIQRAGRLASHFEKHGVVMLKRIILGFTVGIVVLMPLKANAFNDKMLILHNGRPMCVDWWAWPGHMINHGDTLLGTGSCDVPKAGK